jgi:hypothetical protein
MTGEDLEERQRHAAQIQSIFREINERLRETNAAFLSVVGDTEFVCECAQLGCTELMAMTVEEYEDVRLSPTRFAVKPGCEHFFPDAERIVDSHPSFLIVEKFGPAGALAVSLDPRATLE